MSAQPSSMDQSVVLDLSRHLRRPEDGRPEPNSTPRRVRPDIASLEEAISTAAHTITASEQHIGELQDQHREFEDLAERLKTKLGEVFRAQQAADAKAREEAQRADRAEAKVANLEAHIRKLEVDLDDALADLHTVADVITRSLIGSR